ncbi:Rhodanese-related sulfurtransferase [Microlunatus flavus]|uniref:Rhodanese-related sulfurtransferase n=1 Tax=Microlunatus flavus TaxID=1036181 RepID=A0A1H9LNL5_9ACTN|nr:Rhodanese-related sulfurtransferase [Microlunatus flavus]
MHPRAVPDLVRTPDPDLAAASGAAPPARIDGLLARAREGWDRLTAPEAYAAVADGALLVDTRTDAQRARTGELPGALVIDRTVLEWRLDPTSPVRIPEADARPRVVVVCRQGYSSSLAARSLRDLGLDATDVVDGVEGWLAAGLPLVEGPADVRE